MKKIKLIGIKKSKDYNYLVFPKKQEIFSFLREFLKNFGIEGSEAEGIGRPIDKIGEYNIKKELKIRNYSDKYVYFQTKDYDIDIVFGKNRVFMFIHTKKDMQNALSKLINHMTR